MGLTVTQRSIFCILNQDNPGFQRTFFMYGTDCAGFPVFSLASRCRKRALLAI